MYPSQVYYQYTRPMSNEEFSEAVFRQQMERQRSMAAPTMAFFDNWHIHAQQPAPILQAYSQYTRPMSNEEFSEAVFRQQMERQRAMAAPTMAFFDNWHIHAQQPASTLQPYSQHTRPMSNEEFSEAVFRQQMERQRAVATSTNYHRSRHGL